MRQEIQSVRNNLEPGGKIKSPLRCRLNGKRGFLPIEMEKKGVLIMCFCIIVIWCVRSLSEDTKHLVCGISIHIMIVKLNSSELFFLFKIKNKN
jgi:hypothetical protein